MYESIVVMIHAYSTFHQSVGGCQIVPVHEEVIEKVITFALENGFSVHNLEYSPIKGPEGNIEYLVYIEKDDNPKKEESVDIHEVVEAAHGSLDK